MRLTTTPKIETKMKEEFNLICEKFGLSINNKQTIFILTPILYIYPPDDYYGIICKILFSPFSFVS